MTTKEQIAQLNLAISSIENGAQEYRLGSRQLRRPDLSLLYQERRNLQRQQDNENGGGTFVAAFDRR